MKAKLGLLLLILLIAVGCEDSTESKLPTEDITNTIGMTFKEIPAATYICDTIMSRIRIA